jgi:hypothetical protein
MATQTEKGGFLKQLARKNKKRNILIFLIKYE